MLFGRLRTVSADDNRRDTERVAESSCEGSWHGRVVGSGSVGVRVTHEDDGARDGDETCAFLDGYADARVSLEAAAKALAPVAAARVDAAATALAARVDASRGRANGGYRRHSYNNTSAESPNERRRRIIERRIDSNREHHQAGLQAASLQARPSGLLPRESPQGGPQQRAPRGGLGAMIRADDDVRHVRHTVQMGVDTISTPEQPNALYEACRKGSVNSVKVR